MQKRSEAQATATKAPEDFAYTVTHESFGPLPKHMNHWGKDPEAPVPDTSEAFSQHIARLAGDAGEASDLAEALITYAPEKVVPLLWAVVGQAKRAERRLNETSDALHKGHTENVGHRLEDVGTMVLHLESVVQLTLNVHSRYEDNSELVSGVICSASNAIEYVRKRLDFLVYESELPLD